MKKKNKCCENCGELIPCGEGDHICGAGDAKLVLVDYAPAEDYFWCEGKCWEEN